MESSWNHLESKLLGYLSGTRNMLFLDAIVLANIAHGF